jgi:hypothetical protein
VGLHAWDALGWSSSSYSYCCLPYSARQNRNGRELQHRPSSLSNPPSRSPINYLSLFPRIARLRPTKLVSVPTACPPLEPPAPSYRRVSSSAPPWLHESPIRSDPKQGKASVAKRTRQRAPWPPRHLHLRALVRGSPCFSPRIFFLCSLFRGARAPRVDDAPRLVGLDLNCGGPRSARTVCLVGL